MGLTRFFKNPPDWQTILNYFRGSELQNYFLKILEEKFKAIVKPQYVDQIPRGLKKVVQVGALLKGKVERDNLDQIVNELGKTFRDVFMK